ncbi:hypothetical protein [Pseudotamlana carrageenivorans]|uniref:PD-(D/E)XK endonuclease-like domain-containing protein n=1 Tax=Pseudotamlana carrageenivorans TaxID=2069432 RepID=A0A2I7SJP7_9FLAO|nr:hypothetical protein [Tamlana carrageenivorans]AUS06129.1 hypothetical protein C1A40_12000 [Tamlana carrageenivorans]
MIKLMFKTLIILNFIILLTENANAETIDPVIEGCVEQLDYLIDYNKSNIEKDNFRKNWYIYFIGEDKDYLQSYISKINRNYDGFENILTEGVEIDKNYLKILNDYLVLINQSSKLEIYVAFIGADREIVQPLAPKKINTFNKGRVFIDSLINNSAKSYPGLDLERAKKELGTYNRDFLKKIKEIYASSNMSKISEKPNHIMPFSHKTTRIIYNQKDEITTDQKWAISMHIGKREKRFNYQAFKDLYNKQVSFGSDELQKKIAKQVITLQEYFSLDIPPPNEYKEDCGDLLKLAEYSPLLESRILEPVLRRNPCILRDMGKLGPIDYTKSKWMEELEMMIVTPLYVAILAPVAAEFVIPSLIEVISVERGVNASKAMAATTIIEAGIIYYWIGTPEQQADIGKSILGVNPVNVAYEGVKGLIQSPFLVELSVDCVYNGTKLSEGIINPEEYEFTFETKSCINGVFISAATKIGLHQGGQFFKTLRTLANENPQAFVNGWARVFKDLGKDQQEAFKSLAYGIFKEIGISPNQINSFLQRLRNKIKANGGGDLEFTGYGDENPNNRGSSTVEKIDIEGKINNSFDDVNVKAKDFPENEAEILATNNDISTEAKKFWQNHEVNVTNYLRKTYGYTKVGRQITVDIKIKGIQEPVRCRLDNLIDIGGGKFKIIDAKSSLKVDLSKQNVNNLSTIRSTKNQKIFYKAIREGNVENITPKGSNASDYFELLNPNSPIIPKNIKIDPKIEFLVNDNKIKDYNIYKILLN